MTNAITLVLQIATSVVTNWQTQEVSWPNWWTGGPSQERIEHGTVVSNRVLRFEFEGKLKEVVLDSTVLGYIRRERKVSFVTTTNTVEVWSWPEEVKPVTRQDVTNGPTWDGYILTNIKKWPIYIMPGTNVIIPDWTIPIPEMRKAIPFEMDQSNIIKTPIYLEKSNTFGTWPE